MVQETSAPNGQGQMVLARAGASPAQRGGRTGWAWINGQYDRIVVPATFQGMQEARWLLCSCNHALICGKRYSAAYPPTTFTALGVNLEPFFMLSSPLHLPGSRGAS